MSLSKLIEQKRREKIRQSQKKTAKTLVAGVAVGTVAGALSGILFAPKAGKETRANLKGTAKDINVKMKEKATNATNTCKGNVLEAKSKIKEYLNNKNKNIQNLDSDKSNEEHLIQEDSKQEDVKNENLSENIEANN